MNCITQTKTDRKISLRYLKEADQDLTKFSNVELVKAETLLNPEQKRISDQSMCWFVSFESRAYMIQRGDQMIPKGSKVLTSTDSDQMLFISAISGGSSDPIHDKIKHDCSICNKQLSFIELRCYYTNDSGDQLCSNCYDRISSVKVLKEKINGMVFVYDCFDNSINEISDLYARCEVCQNIIFCEGLADHNCKGVLNE